MTYTVKEIFLTLQGEGAFTGCAAVFCRFAGCNLWSGRERDRFGAVCKFCDTEFVGGSKYDTAWKLATMIKNSAGAAQLVVFTGGEPLLQLDTDLIGEMRERGFKIAIETNGTIEAPDGIDWICVSPKAGTQLRQRKGDELKLVYPQDGIHPRDFEALEFDHFFIQPRWDEWASNVRPAVKFCLENPRWRLSLQTHKYIGLP